MHVRLTDDDHLEFRELRGANVHSTESVLVARVGSDGAADLPWMLERPSAPLDRCAALLEALGLSASDVRGRQRWPLGSLLQAIAEQLVRRIGAPTAPPPSAPADPDRELVLSLEPAALTRACCEWSLALVSAAATTVTVQDQDRLRAQLDAFDHAHAAPEPWLAALDAACRQRGIPWHRIDHWPSFVQLGEGVLQARTWRGVASTDKVALSFARDKAASNRMLARFGVPVARQAALTDPVDAWRIANQIGLPVVVKPRRGSLGRAVSVGLATRADVDQAVHHAKQVDQWVLIESLVPGEDHRVLVAGGRLIGVVRRLPASVLGDGRSTIGELLAQTNADPRRTTDKRTPLNPIRYDEESERVLRSQGWTPDAVPPAGLRVRLKSAANWSAGGSLHDVTDTIHPDNAEMCVRAVVLCGLDVGGADFLTPDVTRSFREVGGALCEVNALPAVQVPHVEGRGDRNLMGDMVDALYPERRWRIPTVVVYGEDPDPVGRGVVAALSASGLSVGYAGPTGTTAAGWVVAAEPQPVHAAHRLLIEDPTTEVVVVAVAAGRVLADGVGLARADLVALVDDEAASDPRTTDVRRSLSRTGARILRSRDCAAIAELVTRSSGADRESTRK